MRKRKEGAAVSEEFGPNFITVTDEDGNDIELELLDVLEHKGQTYMAFFPAVPEEEADEDSDDYGMVILKSIQENGEELLSTRCTTFSWSSCSRTRTRSKHRRPGIRSKTKQDKR